MKIRFGIVGTNSISDWFLGGAMMDERFELSAVYSRAMEKGREFAAKYNVERVYTTFEEMSEWVDAVYIASPNSCHADQSLFFLKRGIHVLCEKAFCSNAREAVEMIAAAKKSGAVLMEAMISTVNPNFIKLRDSIHRVGRVRKYAATYCQYSSRYNKLKDGIVENAFKREFSNGALMDIGVYTIYPMVVLFGRPKSIRATGHILGTGVDGSGAALFEYDGMDAIISYSKISDSFGSSEIQGEEGALIIDKISNPRKLWFKTKSLEEDLSVTDFKDDYYYEVKEFIDLIEEGKIEHEINSHENSLIVMEIMDEIRRQAGVIFPADTTP